MQCFKRQREERSFQFNSTVRQKKKKIEKEFIHSSLGEQTEKHNFFVVVFLLVSLRRAVKKIKQIAVESPCNSLCSTVLSAVYEV